MNKYKDALNELFVYSKHSANKVEILSLTESYEKLEQLINEHFELKERYEKLVDKATPKKPTIRKSPRGYIEFECPGCHKATSLNFYRPCCVECGQKLNW